MSQFDFVQTRSEKRLASRQKWKRIKRGAKAKRFRIRLEASRNLTEHREELDEKGILSDDFDFVKSYNPRWLKTRAFVLKRDRFTCYCCGKIAKNNHCHHILPRRYKGSSEATSNLCTLCPIDHRWVDLEIWRQISGRENLPTPEIRAACIRILEMRKRMVNNED